MRGLDREVASQESRKSVGAGRSRSLSFISCPDPLREGEVSPIASRSDDGLRR